jgi:hypothetical protein
LVGSLRNFQERNFVGELTPGRDLKKPVCPIFSRTHSHTAATTFYNIF